MSGWIFRWVGSKRWRRWFRNDAHTDESQPVNLIAKLGLLLLATIGVGVAAEDVTWLVTFDGARLPQAQGWTPVGPAAAAAKIVDGALRLSDDSTDAAGCFRAVWMPDPTAEIVVEAKVKVDSVTSKERRLRMGFSDGAPIHVLVSDGRRQEGLMLYPEKIANFLDRVVLMDTRSDFHTYRLTIRGSDMSVSIDGKPRIRGEGAFWKTADAPEAFIQFGSNSPKWMGAAHWASVRLGVRKTAPASRPAKLRITVGKSWEIPPTEPGVRNTRPSLYDMGQGLLLMNVCQGPDAVYEPFGVLKSTDEGKTWLPIKDLQYKTFAPEPMLRLSSGEILGLSRWNLKYDHEDGVFVGMSFLFDAKAQTFRMFENRTKVPEKMFVPVFCRDVFELGNGELMASFYCRVGKFEATSYRAYLVKSIDRGATWNHFSTVADHPEITYAFLSAMEMTAVMRDGPRRPLQQTWSHDGGKTWEPTITLEVGSVAPSLIPMRNGVLVCSYGRPGSNLMFSTDQGKTWGQHRVISDGFGFNWSAIREIRPGRLLYVHDDGRLRAVYVDVERQD